MATNIVRQEQNSERFTSGSREDGRQAQPKHYDGKTQSGLNGRELLAQGLGWFSIGLGLIEVAAPGSIAKLIGVNSEKSGVIRALGVRELAHGIGILAPNDPTLGVWSRVGGDAIDLSFLGAALLSPDTKKGKVIAATAAVVGVAVLDAICAQQLSRYPSTNSSGVIHVKKSLTINRSVEDVYQFWRDFQNLPRFMHHLESVQVTGNNRSHWVAKAPAGMTVEWDAEITEDKPNELIAWRSLENSSVENSGSVRFEHAPGKRGTVLRVDFNYSPPGGIIGAGIAKLFGEEPEQQVEADLRRFKQVIETGEVVLSDGSLQGTGLTSQRPGQPLAAGA
jgi:uncharacterized membrane protein